MTSYSYDLDGNKLSTITTKAGAQKPWVYQYDVLNRLSHTTDDGFRTEVSEFDAIGLKSRMNHSNGSYTLYSYDEQNRLTGQSTFDSSDQLISSYSYTLSPTGLRTQIVENSGRISDYVYDDLYRLTSETITDAVNGNHQASYTYDAVGNRLTSQINGTSAVYAYDNNDRLSQAGGIPYDYDANGNMIKETEDGISKDYIYNKKNELIEFTSGTDTYQHQYDPHGIRTESIVNGVMTEYLIDHNQTYAQVLLETSLSNQISYTYGDDLLTQESSSGLFYFHYDGLGSTRLLTDSTSSVTDTYQYDAFGNLLAQTGTTENNYLFTGEQFDPNLGFYYLRARYMNPQVGRFVSMDTWAGENYDPISLNKYLYANADPVNHVDPTGNFSIGSLMTGLRVGATIGSYAQTAFAFHEVATGELSAFQLGLEIIAGNAGGRIIKLFSKKFKKCRIGNSFVEGTLISTIDGLVPIEEINIGDLVYSFEEKSGAVVLQEVIHLIEGYKEHELVTLGLSNNDEVVVTDGHPFYLIDENNWQQAKNLQVGDELIDIYGAQVSILQLRSDSSTEKVYNLTIENTHNYFVGEARVLVHNSTCRIPHRATPNLPDRDWDHIFERHIPGGSHPSLQGDLFAAGTTRDQVLQAAKRLVSSGTRQSDPSKVRQVFEKKMVINGKRANYRVVVDSDNSNRIITMFPIEGG